MDFHMKQWREQQQQDESDSVVKFQGGLLHIDPTHHHPLDPSPSLSLFSPEPSSTKFTFNNLSAYPPDDSSNRLPKMGGGYFSVGQWQELELQALIYRHMLTGAAIPPELLHLLLKKSFVNSPSPSHYQLPHPLQQYPHFQPPLLQAGYWGRGAMDPEPGRCRRTDGKKWRCGRDIVVGHKYCERHIHRGRNRSRKPVEIPTPATTTNISVSGLRGGGSGSAGGNRRGGVLKSTNTNTSAGGSNHPFSILAGGGNQFGLTGHTPSFDLQHLSQSNSESMIENKCIYKSHSEMSEDDKSGGRILRHFFDDWPRSIHEPVNTSSNSSSFSSTTNLSISVPENPSSDFSLKLSTGDGDVVGAQEGNVGRERPLLDWGMAWGSNRAASMGGPLAEALRSSTSKSSPTSVLHQLQQGGSTSEVSYIST